jgi:hypothetical protein
MFRIIGQKFLSICKINSQSSVRKFDEIEINGAVAPLKQRPHSPKTKRTLRKNQKKKKKQNKFFFTTKSAIQATSDLLRDAQEQFLLRSKRFFHTDRRNKDKLR